MKNLKQIISIFLCILIAFSAVSVTSLSAIAAETDSSSVSLSYGNFEYIFYNNSIKLVKYTGTDSELTIPSEIAGTKVTRIGYMTFNKCDTLTKVVIPETISYIEQFAFTDCTNLKSLTIPESVKYIEKPLISNCENVTVSGYYGSVAHDYAIANNIPFSYFDSAHIVGDIKLKLNLNNGIYTNTIELEQGTYQFKVNKNGVDYGYKSSFNNTLNSACYISDCSDYTTLNANGGKYTFTFDPSTDILSVSYESVWSPTVNLIGDIELELTRTADNFNLYSATTPLTSGSYKFKIAVDDITYCCGSALSGNVYNIAYSSAWKNATTYTTTGGTYNFTYNIDTNKLTILLVEVENAEYDYKVQSNGSVKITSYKGSETNVTVPTIIDGYTVTGIESYAFKNCTGIKSVIIPDSITSLGSGIFSGCTNLTYVKLPKGIKYIEAYMFASCISLTEFEIPDTVTTINLQAFSNCSNLSSITIPDSVSIIGDGAFYNCRNLTSIQLPPIIKKLSSNIFNGCTKLSNVNIPDSVTYIDVSAFANCVSLKKLTIPDSVTYINEYAFTSCDNLILYCSYNSTAHKFAVKNNMKFALSDSVNIVGDIEFELLAVDDVYKAVVELEEGTYQFKVSKHGIDYGCGSTFIDTIYKVQYNSAWSKATTFNASGGKYTFTFDPSTDKLTVLYTKSNITTVNLIGDINLKLEKALDNPYIYSAQAELTAGSYEFKFNINGTEYGCGSTLSGNVYNIMYSSAWKKYTTYLTTGGTYKFTYNIKTNTMDLVRQAVTDTTFDFTLLDNGTVKITKYNGNNSEVTIPSTIGGYSVVSLADELFKENTTLTSITISDGIKSIGSSTFKGCTNLTQVVLPDSIEKIEFSTFSQCEKLESLDLPANLSYIGGYAFSSCSKLASIEIPDTVVAIDNYAFMDCDSLTSVTIPKSVKSLANNAFRSCGYLKDVTISEGVESIEFFAFFNCIRLENITIPKSVTYISPTAFQECNEFSISGYYNSTAHQYAKARDISFNFFDSANIIGDINAELTLSNGVYKANVTLAQGTYQFKVNKNGVDYGCGSTFNETIYKITYNSAWSKSCTFTVSGGKYSFMFDPTTDKLTVLPIK